MFAFFYWLELAGEGYTDDLDVHFLVTYSVIEVIRQTARGNVGSPPTPIGFHFGKHHKIQQKLGSTRWIKRVSSTFFNLFPLLVAVHICKLFLVMSRATLALQDCHLFAQA